MPAISSTRSAAGGAGWEEATGAFGAQPQNPSASTASAISSPVFIPRPSALPVVPVQWRIALPGRPGRRRARLRRLLPGGALDGGRLGRHRREVGELPLPLQPPQVFVGDVRLVEDPP